MDIAKILAELKAELAAIDEAMVVLQRLAYGQGKRRGRPPAWMRAVKASLPAESAKPAKTTSKRVISPEMRARMAAGQRKRWAEYHKNSG